MRGVYTSINEIRRRVYTEIARMAYESDDYAKTMEGLPYQILPGERASYRDSIFLERAIVGERLRLAMGSRMASKSARPRSSTMSRRSSTSLSLPAMPARRSRS